MRNALLLASTLLAAPLLLGGCDDGGTGGTGGTGGGAGGQGGSGASGGGGSVTVEEACDGYVAALCGQLDTCAPFLLQISYGDKATCVARLTPVCLQTPELPGSNLTAAHIQTCASAYASATCEQVYEGTPAVCRVLGDKADGEPCVAASQCAGFLCSGATEAECGTCAAEPGDGDPCDPTDDTCGPGLFCIPNTMTCAAHAEKGQPCTDQKRCKPGLSCNQGSCGDLVPVGGDCSSGETCDIAVGAFCGFSSGTCEQLLVANAGEACGLVGNAFTFCEAGATCSEQNTCVPRAKDGEACTIDPETGDSNCLAGATCIAGTCQAAFLQCN